MGPLFIVFSLKIDTLFKHKLSKVPKFLFDRDVADVFDNMIIRSIPVYREVHEILGDIARRYFPFEGVVYDLGCSTGETMMYLIREFKNSNKKAVVIGVDKSESMLDKCREKFQARSMPCPTLIKQALDTIELQQCDLVIINYTLQFLNPSSRQDLLRKVQSKLRCGGLLFLSEKIKGRDKNVHKMITDLYGDFKRKNGYSELEIAQKKEALENVLIPLSPEEQINMMIKAGFQSCELIFRKYNFATYIGCK